MQVFRVTALPRSGCGWSEDPYDWVGRVFDLNDELSASGRAMSLECGIELPRVDGVAEPRIRVICDEFGHALVWVRELAVRHCAVDQILTIDDYRIASVPSNWVART